MRQDVEDFAAGADPGPELEAMQALFRYISVIEIAAERLHAQVSQHIRGRPQHGPVLVAFSQHCNILEKWLAKSPRELLQYCELLNRVRRPMDAVEQLGFMGHPVIQQMLRAVGGKRELLNRHPHVSKVVEVIVHASRIPTSRS